MDAAHHAMNFTTSFRIMLVDRETGDETTQIAGVVSGGTIERNQDTSVTEQATLDYVGELEDFGNNLLRVYADLTYSDRTSESICLGTFLPNGPKCEIDGGENVLTPLTLYGRLRELIDDQFANPISVPAGSNPLEVAASICKECNLDVAAFEDTDYVTSTTWIFGLGKGDSQSSSSKLDAVNALLDLVGYQSARTDEYGRVVFRPYVKPADRPTVWTFAEGADARFLREMTDECDWFDVANQVLVIYSNQDDEYVGQALDEDPDSPFSTVNRGRIISRTETFSDIPKDKTALQIQQMADDKAAELLANELAVFRRITFTHLYAPISFGDRIRLTYPTGGITEDLVVRTQKISLKAGLPVECEARSFTQ